MSWLGSFERASLQVRVVLVVTSQGISWYRCEGAQITDQLKHSYEEEPLKIVGSCQWLKKYIDCKWCSIELVVDTELDDLDRVKLIDSTNRITRSWNIKKVLYQLRREYSDATVSGLPKYLYPEIGTVLYSQLTVQSSSWLKKLDESGVVVSHVITSTQLHLDVFRDCPSPVLLHMFDGHNRHRLLLTVDGLPLHMRQAEDEVSRASTSAFAESYLSETLKYLSESVFSSLDKLLLVFPRETNNYEQTEYPDEYLAKQYLGLPCDISYQHISLPHESEPVGGSLVSLGNLTKGRLSDFIKTRSPALLNLIIKSLSTKRKSAQYAVARRSAKSTSVFSQSIATINKRQHVFLLRRCTCFVFLVFMFVVLATSRAGMLSFQNKKQSKVDLHSLKADVLELEDKAATLHQSPFYVMDTLNRIHDFKEVAIPTPQKIMSSVSAAVKGFPSVTVTGLTWSVIEKESDSTFVTINSVSIRDHYWGDGSSEYKTMVELSGQVVSESSLRKKQNRLNDFISVLSQSENIEGLRVIDSPAKSAGSSHSMLESAGVFKIHFSIRSI